MKWREKKKIEKRKGVKREREREEEEEEEEEEVAVVAPLLLPL